MRTSPSRHIIRLRARMRRVPGVRTLERNTPSTKRKVGVLATTALAGALAVGAGHYALSRAERPIPVDVKRIVRIVEKETGNHPFVLREMPRRTALAKELRNRNEELENREAFSKVAFLDPESEQVRVFDFEQHGIRSLAELRKIVPIDFQASVDGIVNRYLDQRLEDITPQLKLEIGQAYNLAVFPSDPKEAKELVRRYIWMDLPFSEWGNKFTPRGAEDLHYYLSRAQPRVFLEIERQEQENKSDARFRNVKKAARATPWGAGMGVLAGLAWLLGRRPRKKK